MTDPIRVLWLIKGLGPGGAERLLVTHARLRDRERFAYRVAYLVPWKDHLVPDLAEEGIAATCLGSGRGWDLRWITRLRGLMADVDVVHSHSPLPASVARLLARTVPRSRRPRLVYTEHNEWGKHRRPTRWFNRLTMPLEGQVTAVSEGVKRSMRARRDAVVLRHWIDGELVAAQADRAAVRAELGFTDADVVVGTVANLRWEKGYDVLLDAAATVAGRRPEVTFVSVGQGPLEAELLERRDELGLGERFRFLGYRRDAVRVMSGFDVFCLPSRHEGLPVVLMEASALGLPIVAADVGGVAEALPPGEGSTRLVASGSVDALAEALLAVEPSSASAVGTVRPVEWPAIYEARYACR